MNKEGKNLKLWVGRADLVGDCVLSLPILNYFENKFPNSYKYFPILRKCSQAAPLFLNHPLIDKIVISDFNEGFGENDKRIFDSCDLKTDVRPQHPYPEPDWHNYRNVYEETWVMAGIPLDELYKLPKEQQLPKLEKWFNIEKRENTIAIHGFAGYGKDKMRSPSEEYWKRLIVDLIKLGYKVIRFGHPNEPTFYFNDYSEIGNDKFFDVRNLSLIDQVKMALGCSSYIGTDTGFSIILAAYNEIPQINLMCSWNWNHTKNPLCLAPIGDKCINLHSQIKCDDIIQEEVLENIKKFN